MKEIYRFLEHTPYKNATLIPISTDASFRKYYRLTCKVGSYILMDASLEKESLRPFVSVTKLLLGVKCRVPHIYHEALTEGYLILEDFGDTQLLDVLSEESFEYYYKIGVDEIVKMQFAPAHSLPLYDKAFLHQEMELMQEWFLEKNLSLTLKEDETTMLQNTIDAISAVVLSQPQNLFVHRDFHSRNIMLPQEGILGILDYQDAMSGALTYDLVSLLKDCYIAFEREKIEELALYFRDKKNLEVDDATFLKWFDFTGMQRHMKVLGIFSRLWLRDGKKEYLKDIPLTLRYLKESAARYEETSELASFLETIAL